MDTLENTRYASAQDERNARPARLHQIADQWPLAAYWKRFVEIGLASVLINVFGLATPLFSMLVYDKVIGNNIVDTLYGLGIGMVVFIALDFVLRLIRAFYVEQIAYRSDVDIDAKMVDEILGQRRGRLYSGGELLSKYRDLMASRDVLSSSYMLAVADMPFLAMYLIALMLIGGPVAFVPCLLGAALVAVNLVIKKPVSAYSALGRQGDAKKLAMLEEIAAQGEQIKVSRWRAHFINRWRETTERVSLLRSKARYWSAVNYAVITDGTLLIWVFTLMVGAQMADRNALTVGSLTACSLLSSRAASLIGSFMLLLERFDLFRRTRKEFDEVVAASSDEMQARLPERAVRGEIRLADVHFSFPAGRNAALVGINLTIGPGERVGLVGRNGSGKSTLLRCLAGVVDPTAGRVTLDGATLTAYPADWRATWISYKPQEPLLYEGTLDFNLRADGTVAEAEAVARAMWVTGVDQMLARPGFTLDSHIAPGGANLSGGQRQAVALARALATSPTLLLLDEPTVGLDQDAEQGIIERLMQYCEGRTLVVSTHSLALLRQMDRLIVIQDGRVLVDGPRDQVLVG
ncbi:peptidase domain-containing ABC transporter [Burkholderia pyrrocinia]|uniref:peptidase domain-containing ABC transporter n=1 Tax=Burkholderia pyrrocinia TaxID=60550 RepID=UPI00158B7F10|nr:ATP-binding cassette domain-containing protein [Burkholderia pyrrocinia]